MTFGVTLGKRLMMATSTNMFYVAINYKNKAYMEVAAANINIKIHQLFSKKLILGVHVIIVQRRISGDLTRTCF